MLLRDSKGMILYNAKNVAKRRNDAIFSIIMPLETCEGSFLVLLCLLELVIMPLFVFGTFFNSLSRFLL